MIIDGNDIEKKAMKEFHKGNRKEGLKIQDEFIGEFREFVKTNDHCSCTKACKFHGRCVECVAIHRAHEDHLPNCFHNMINDKIKVLSEITEHTVKDELK